MARPSEFRPIYIRSKFALDFISSIPVSTIAFFAGATMQHVYWYRVFQFTRMLRLPMYFDSLISYIEDDMKFPFLANSGLRHLFQLFCVEIAVNHWFACLFVLVSSHTAGNDDDDSSPGGGLMQPVA